MTASTPGLVSETSWPEWTAVTQPAPGTDPDVYRGECFRCHGTTSGVRDLVVAWARSEHGECREP